ncbi:PD-(D/E)XK nuclease-like domain-containing protein [Sansalvadorimonas verongulae]|uniref:PD-(D/E)XK nuclease-like domain-containing protein n=1 Tax=Sansalvadorimonas verongulae TaxID=2172824 RepID=UPI0018AD1D43|nr:PD-(D/E)XK nuclease-like domain-containing protein [Sansalvadorimonas verongulae]
MDNGIYDNLDEEVYHSDEALSSTVLKELRRSPRHAYSRIQQERGKTTQSLTLGRLLHACVLEPERFKKDYAPPLDPATYPDALVSQENYKACCKTLGLPVSGTKAVLKERIQEAASDAVFWDDLLEQHAKGRELISQADFEICAGVMASVNQHSKASKVFSDGVAERSLFWDDPATGQACRARLDYYREDLGVVFDLKTTTDARLDAFQRDVFKYGYHISAAMYLEGCRQRGLKATAFAWLAIEKEPPYAIGLYMASPEMLVAGDNDFRDYLSTFAACKEANFWPSYSDDFVTIDLPPWAQNKPLLQKGA